MSLFLMIFYWVVTPALVLLIAWRVSRHTRTPSQKRWVKAVTVAILGGLLWLAAGEKAMLDAQVRKMCAKDGGVKVYETVKLPPEKFNKYGQVNFYKPTQGENALGPEYIYKDETHYYKSSNPDLLRIHIQVIRRSDGKLLGESNFYIRRGGDLPGPWHRSSYMCPESSVKTDIFHQLFIIESKG